MMNTFKSALKSYNDAKKRFDFFTIAKQELYIINNETKKKSKSWKGKKVPKRFLK